MIVCDSRVVRTEFVNELREDGNVGTPALRDRLAEGLQPHPASPRRADHAEIRQTTADMDEDVVLGGHPHQSVGEVPLYVFAVDDTDAIAKPGELLAQPRDGVDPSARVRRTRIPERQDNCTPHERP